MTTGKLQIPIYNLVIMQERYFKFYLYQIPINESNGL